MKPAPRPGVWPGRAGRSRGARAAVVAALVLAQLVVLLLPVPASPALAAQAIVARGPASSVVYAPDSTNTLQVPVPAGAQPGDVLIAVLGFGRTGATSQPFLGVPSGWTLVTRTNRLTVGALAVYRHVFAAGESSYTWTTSVPVGGVVMAAAFGGVDTTNPIDVSAGRYLPSGGTTISTPAVTTTVPNAGLVASVFGYVGPQVSTTWVPPTGMVELGDVSVAGPPPAGSRAGSLSFAIQAAPGLTRTKTATASVRQDYGIAILTALRPAAGPVDSPPTIGNVAAGQISPTGATIAWTTNEPADSQVEYGLTAGYGSTTPLNTSMVTNHAQALAGLAPDSTYHYRVKSKDAAGQLTTSGDFTFRTAPAADTTPPVISNLAASGVTPTGATIGWTTSEPADTLVEYGTTTAYGGTTPLNAALVTSHTQALAGLAPSTTYHYRVKSRDAAGNLATSADGTFTTLAAPAGPVPLILDTDIFSDADDVGALATAFGLQLKGEARVIAIGINTRTSRPAVATNSWKCAAAVRQFYSAGNIPIGTAMPNDGTEVNTADFIGPCSQLAPPIAVPDTAVNVFRRALAAEADGSVVIAEAGYSQNLSALLDSPPDAISPLSGRDLIARKVNTLVIMAGGYPSRSGETNLIGNPPAAQNVANNWPTRIVWSGYEVGDAIHTGNTISSKHPTTSPVRVSYEAFVGPNNWIYSYDLTAVYHAVRPSDPSMSLVGPGRNVVDSSGGNVFTLGGGNQYYLRLNDTAALTASIEGLLTTLPAPPQDTTPSVIGNVAAGAVTTTGATITWTTSEPADRQVEYGVSVAYGSAAPATPGTPLGTSHSVALGGLAPNTTYHYRVKSRDAAGNLATSADGTFTTLASAPAGPNDTFDSNTIDPARWTVVQYGSTVSAANQLLQIAHPAGGWTKGWAHSVTPHDQRGRTLHVQVKRPANNGLGGSSYGETAIFLWRDSTNYAYFFIAGGSLSVWVRTPSGEVNLTPGWPAYQATSMQWLRFREVGGTLYFEYASGATSPGAWTVFTSAPTPFPVDAVTFRIAAGANTSGDDVAQFDNVATN